MLYLPAAKGQSLVEYALIISFVVILIIAGLAAFGINLLSVFNDIYEKFSAATGF